jgi:jasmonate ZIM domain-containing protein
VRDLGLVWILVPLGGCVPKISGVFSGEAAPVSMSLLPGAGGEEAERKETMELFPQSAGFGTQDASSDAARYYY